MRRLLIAVASALAGPVAAASPAPTYHVVAQLPAGDGGWDIASVDAAGQRLYVGRSDGVTAIDLSTGKATDRIRPRHGISVVADLGTLVASTEDDQPVHPVRIVLGRDDRHPVACGARLEHQILET